MWGRVKERIPRRGRSAKHFMGYLAKWMFTSRFKKNSQIFHSFWNEVALDYPVQ